MRVGTTPAWETRTKPRRLAAVAVSRSPSPMLQNKDMLLLLIKEPRMRAVRGGYQKIERNSYDMGQYMKIQEREAKELIFVQ